MRLFTPIIRRTSGIAIALVALAPCAPASAADTSFKGKTVTIQVGVTPGGGYDAYARMLARFLPKHLPGSTVVVKNMPGGGGLRLATYLYNAAPKDGTEFGLTEYGVP